MNCQCLCFFHFIFMISSLPSIAFANYHIFAIEYGNSQCLRQIRSIRMHLLYGNKSESQGQVNVSYSIPAKVDTKLHGTGGFLNLRIDCSKSSNVL